MTYTWKTNWILPYESIWGSIEKFKYANEVTNSNLSKIINAKARRTTIVIYPSMYACSNSIDMDALSRLLNRDIFYKTSEELKKLLGCIYNGPDLIKYMISKQRYCPVCIQLGYHSICHQLIFFDRCIFHNTELMSKCPNCGKTSSYVIEYPDNKYGFRCSCEYNYMLEKTPLEIFNGWENNTILNKAHDIIKINSFSAKDDEAYIFPSFIWFLDNYIKSNLFNLSINNFLNIVKSKEPTRNSIKFKTNLKHGNMLNLKASSYSEFQFIMMNEYVKIIKIVAKNIRRKYGIKNSFIQEYNSLKAYFLYDYFKDKLESKELYFENVNVETYAYIMWRKHVEGHEFFDLIHTQTRSRVSDDPLFSIKRNITGTLFYRYAFNEFNLYFDSYRNGDYIPIDDYGILVGTFEHILSNLLIKHYKDWITYAKAMKERRPKERIDFKAVIAPPLIDFVVKYNKNTQHVQLTIFDIKI